MNSLETETALRLAICEEPDNDLPRMAYADWLEEQGEDKAAKFLRQRLKNKGNFLYLTRSYYGEGGWYYKGKNAGKLGDWITRGLWTYEMGDLYYGPEEMMRVTVGRGLVQKLECGIEMFIRLVGSGSFKVHPITEVTLRCRSPVLWREAHGSPSGYIFVEDDRTRYYRHFLPREIFEHYEGDGFYRSAHSSTKGWEHGFMAMQDLSRACVKYGREKSGLSHLP